jgi:Branched-chain amino acid aminotransferase/4-amino-4-deoxychorismate lyase
MFVLNGEIHDGTVAALDLRDRGLTLGDGLFETILVVSGRPFMLDAHLDRLCSAAADLRLPVEREALSHAVAMLLAEAAAGDCALRLAVTRGPGARGLRIPADATPNVLVTMAPWQPPTAFTTVTLATVGIRRNETSPLSRMKTLAYLDNILALEEAAARGADDALVLNTAGRVAATSMANLFIIRANELLTPPVRDGVLPGTLRAFLLAQAAKAGLAARETSFPPEDLFEADAVLAANSLRLVMQVAALDGRALPRRAEKAVAALRGLVRDAIAAACGRDPFAAGPPVR